MEDKSLFTSSQPRTISEGLQNFIDAMVEEIVLEGRPFDTQKKYLKKFSENEGLDYDKLEADIITFIEILDCLKTAFNKLHVKLAEEKGRECYISEAMVGKLLKNSKEASDIPPKKEVISNEPVPIRQSDSCGTDQSSIFFKVNGVEFKMVKVEGGTFWMGAQKSDPNGQNYDSEAGSFEDPVHKVTINGYYMGETVVTQALWRAVTGEEPRGWMGLGGWKDKFGRGDLYPAYRVNYGDIVREFLPKLNQLTGKLFRLPKEAEWEYAARGGNRSQGFRYAGSNSIDDVAWYENNSGNRTHPVKMKRPNELGLYDMSGNMFEQCADWLPAGNQVVRGGSYASVPRSCRVSYRCGTLSLSEVGFRLALDLF